MRQRALLSTPFLAALLAILTWPIATIAPGAGPDPSWQAALYMGLEGGLQFGREIVFTYGPLGFLHAPVLYGEGLWLLALAYHALTWFALTLSLVWVARRALPLPLALTASFVLLVVGHLYAVTPLIAFLWCFVAVSEEPPPFARPLVVYGGGALAALELLGKVNYGASVLALCLVALLAMPARRANLPRFAAVFAAALLVLWLVTGQALANLPDFASNSLQIVSGYSKAMGTQLGSDPWEVPLAIAAAALLLAATAFATRGAPRRVQVGSLVLLVLFAYLSFKQDFVRRGPDSATEFALLMTGAALAIGARFAQRRWPLRVEPRVVAAGLVAGLLALVVWALPSASFWSSLEPGPHVSILREDLHAFLSPSERRSVQERGRAEMRSAYRLPAPIRRRIGERPVAVLPWEIGVAWAYGFAWQPLPVIQEYVAYTPALDHLNSAALEEDGPATILRQSAQGDSATLAHNVDDRYPAWEAPAATLALLCHYRAVITTPRWQLLERAGERCGPATPIGTVRAETGSEIPVPPPPRPDQLVFARVHGLGLEPLESARSLIYRAPTRTVSFDGGPDWTMVEATAGDGLILSVPAASDFPRPFQLAPGAGGFTLEVDDAGPRLLEVEFFAQPLGA